MSESSPFLASVQSSPGLLFAFACLVLVVGVVVVLYLDNRRQRRAAVDLASSVSHYRMLFDSNPNPMYVYDVDTLDLLAVNIALLAQYGYDQDELPGRCVLTLHSEAERDSVRQVIRTLANTREPQFKHRWLHLRKNGERFPVEIFSQPTLYGGRAARLVVVRDLTEQARAEAELLSQRQFRESLLEALPTPVFYKDRNGRYLGLNEAFVRFFGASREQLVGKSAWEIAPPELAAKYQAADDALYAAADQIQVYNAQVSTGNGLRDVVFNKAVFRDHRGEVAGLIGAVIDITERNAAEHALRESEARLAQILHNSPLPIFVIDTDHRVVVWNPACESTFGRSAAEMVGSNRAWSAFYPEPRPVMADIVLDGGREPDVARYYEGRYRPSSLNPDAFEAEDFFPNLGPQGRWLYFTASPLRDGEGRVIGAVETLLDISERKQAEQEVQQLNAQLEAKVVERTAALARANLELKQAMKQLVQTEKLASLGSLVAGVAHELNTPLGNVLTVATALRDRTATFAAEVEQGEGLRRSTIRNFVDANIDATGLIERSAQRAADLIGSFKQVAVDQTSMRRRDFRLAEVLDEILSTLRPTLRRTSHEISVDVPGDIVLDSYPGPFEQVISNLILNSLMHGFENRSDGRIAISARQEDDSVRLVYTDNGQGMSASVVQQAFDPFFTTKLGQGGSGLGLYIVYNLVTAVLGGNVSLSSQPATGVAFDIVLPLSAPRLSERGEGE